MGDRFYQYVTTHVHLNQGIVDLLSGPSATTAYIAAAFGLRDRNIVASVSTASFHTDFPQGQTFIYPGPHQVTLFADVPAFQAFLAHLSAD
jgi:hypothetical protein